MREGLWLAYLYYGWGGSGKTFTGTSGLVDHASGRLLAEGKWVTFGRESNPRIMLPDSYRKLASGRSLEFRSPDLKDRQWLSDFRKFAERLYSNARKGQHLDVLVFDGFAEFDIIFERTHKLMQLGGDNVWKAWADMLDEFYATTQILNPKELGCHVIWTTRVATRKLGTEDKGRLDDDGKPIVVGADPDWINTEYYPAVRGKFHQYLPNYFDMVLYMDTDTTTDPKTKVSLPVHRVHMLRTGDFFIKNCWDDKWIAAEFPPVLHNPTFYDIQHKLEDFNGAPHILPRPIDIGLSKEVKT